MVLSGDKKAGQTLVVTSPGPPVGRGRPGLKGNTPGALPGVSSHSAGLPPAHVMLGTTRGEVFSNKTRVIPLGGRLCPKASLFHPTQQSPGARGAPWGAVSHISVLDYGVLPGGQADIQSSPRCQSSHLITLVGWVFTKAQGRTTGPSCCRPSTSAQLTWSHCASAQSLS